MTTDGEERALECGCREVYDASFEAWAVLELCTMHAGFTAKADAVMPRILDHELDAMVYDAAGGHRVSRIMPADPYRKG